MKIFYLSILSVVSIFLYPRIGFTQMTANDFLLSTPITDLSITNDLELADIDSDGLSDVIALDFSTGASKVSVYRNISSGVGVTLSTAVDLVVSDGPLDIEIGDINNDGKLDIVTSNSPANTIGVFLNTSTSGSISFGAVQEFAVLDNATEVKLADFDMDGKLDFAVCASVDNFISVFRNTTAASSTTVELVDRIDLVLSGASLIDVGDLDQNGYIDIIASNGSFVTLFRNNATAIGEISFTNITSFSQNSASIKLNDMNEDGFPDLAVTSFTNDYVRIYTNNSSGAGNFIFGDVVTMTNGGLNPYRIAHGDLDGDNLEDMVVSNYASSSVSVYRNTSTEGVISFENDASISAGDLPRGISIGDLTGNGVNDFAVTNYSYGTITVLQNRLTESLAMGYPFSNNANDESGNGFHGTTNFDNAGGFSYDRYGQASHGLEIGNGGEGGYVQIEHAGQWDFRSEVAVSFWVRANELATEDESHILFREDGFGEIGIDANAQMTFKNENGTYVAATPSFFGVWNMFSLTINSDNELRMFVNGGESQISLENNPEAGQFLVIDRPTILGSTAFIGDSTLNAADANWFNGSIDDLRVRTKSTYTNEEIESLYNNEVSGGSDRLVSRFLFTNGELGNSTANFFVGDFKSVNDVSVSPTLMTDRFGNTDQALFFDNTGNNLHVFHERSIYLRDQFSMSMWVNPSSFASEDEFGDVLISDNSSGRLMISSSGQLMFHYVASSGSGTLVSEENLMSTDGWQMVSYSIASDMLKVYHNGQLVNMINIDDQSESTVSDISDYTNYGRPDRFILAQNDEDGELKRYYHGGLDDVDVYQRELSDEEVQALYLAQKVINTETDFTNYSITNQVGESVIDYGTHEIDLIMPLGVDITTLVAGFEVSDGAVVSISGGVQTTLSTENDFTNSITYTVTAEDGVTTQDWIVSVTDGVLMNYSFNGNAENSESSSYHGVLGDGATATTFPVLTTDRDGIDNTAYYFDGGDYMTLTGSENIDLSGALTVSAWINPAGFTVGEPEILSNLASSLGFDFKLTGGVDTQKNLKGEIIGAGFTNAGEIFPNQWYHVAMTYELNTAIILYINGVEVIRNDGLTDADLQLSSKALHVGQSFFGKIDDLKVYHRKLSSNEIVVLHDESKIFQTGTEILSFSFDEQNTTATIENGTVNIQVAKDTDLSNLVPTFTLSSGAAASINGTAQTSGVSSNDFTNPLTYAVTAEDLLTTQDWIVTVDVALTDAKTDSLALLALYNATDGAGWTTSWDLNAEVSTWHGVTFTEGLLTHLTLINNNLVGTIPPEIGDLKNLTYLQLHENSLSGEIPVELTTLSNLTFLNLGVNSLTGSIPSEIENLTQLQYLFLAENEFSGSIPTTTANLSKLILVDYGKNNLTGSIPIELASLPNLTHLFLHENALTGSIPTEFGNFETLEFATLANNQLTGEIPSELGNVNTITQWIFHDNQLTGSIPASLSNSSELTHLYFNHNLLSGIIPAELGSLSKLEYLHLGSNQLTGAVPGAFSNLSAIVELYISDNELDELPDFSGTNLADNITYFDVADNHFNFEELIPNAGITGINYGSQLIDEEINTSVNGGSSFTLTVDENHENTVFQWTKDQVSIEGATSNSYVIESFSSDDIGIYSCVMTNVSIGVLTIYRNNITLSENEERAALVALHNATEGASWTNKWDLESDISTWYGVTLTDGLVTELALTNNNLIGTIPPEIGDLKNLTHLYLHENSLSGELPVDLGNLSSLEWLSLNDNQLTGVIPEEFGNLSSMNTISLADNQLTGSIPASIGNLNQLSQLNLWNNQLTGVIPDELAGLTNISYLNLSSNLLEGEISTVLGGLTNLEILYLHDNALTGSIPTELENLTILTTLYLSNNQLTGAVPAEFSNLSALTNLQLGDNELDDLPDFSAASWFNTITNFGVENNHFNFEELVPNANITGIVYGSQVIDNEIDDKVNSGSSYTLSVVENHVNTLFQWTKDEVNIEGATLNSYTIDDFSIDDNGVYSCIMTNTLINGLTITRSNIVLTEKQATLGYYPFNGNSLDESGNDTHGVQVTFEEVEQAIAMTEDRFGNSDAAFLFEDDGDNIKIEHTWDFSAGRTFVAWIRPSAFASSEKFGDVILDQVNGDRLMIRADGELFYHYQTSSGYSDVGSGKNVELNDWQSVAVSIDASSIVKFYYNGMIQSTSASLDFKNDPSNIFRIASNDLAEGLDRYFDGAIDDVSVFNKVLTDQQINDLFVAESGAIVDVPSIVSVTDIEDFRFTFKWSEVENARRYDFEISRDENFTDIFTTADASGTATTMYGVSANTTYYLRIRSSNGYLNSIWSDVVSFKTKEERSVGLIAHYPFDDGGSVNDYSANGNEASKGDNTIDTTFPTITQDREGGNNAYSLDGVDDYFSINDGSGVSVAEDLTMNIWVKVSEAKQGLLFKDEASNYGHFALDASLSISYRYFDGSGTTTMDTGEDVVPTNEWSMLTVTREAAQIKLYINGQLLIDQEAVNPDGASIITAIGQGEGTDSFFAGAMDDIRIYNVAITQEAVLALYLEERTGIDAVEVFDSALSTTDYVALEYVGNRNGQFGQFGKVFELGVGSLQFRTNYSDLTVWGDNDTGNNESDLNGAPIEITEAGYYFISYDVDGLTYGITKINSVGVIGDVLTTGWAGADVDLSDQGNGVFEGDITFLDGEWKVRANDVWDHVDWGGNETDNELVTFGPNLSTAAGDYTVSIDILQNTYSLSSGQPPVIGIPTYGETYILGGDGMVVSVPITDSDGDISEVSIYHKKVGATDDTKVNLSGGSSPYTHQFSDDDIREDGLTFYFEAADERGNTTTSVVYTIQASLGASPVLGLISFDETYTLGDDGVDISVLATDPDDDISEVSIYHRKVTDTAYEKVDISGGSSPYTHQFSDDDIRELGLEFYIEVTDVNGGEDISEVFRISTQIEAGTESVTGLVQSSDSIDYSIISMPFKSASVGTLLSDLGPTDKEKWRLLHYGGSSYSDMTTSSTLSPGKGYWFLNNTSSSINLGAAESVEIDENAPFEISLRDGYSQIGNPFPHTLDWQEVIDHNAANGITVEGLLKWNRGWSANQKTLSVYQGAFINHDASQNIEIPIAAINVSGRVADSESLDRNHGTPGSEDWSFGINLSNDILHYNVSIIGVSPESELGEDRKDLNQLPRLAGYLDLIFDNGHTRDMISMQDNYRWSFEVQTNYLGEATVLSWENFPLQGNDYSLILKDLQSQKIINLSEESSYAFHSNASSHGFELYFGKHEEIMNQIFENEDYLGIPYPNPSEGRLTVPLSMVEDANASILLRDLTGRVVYSEDNLNLKKGYQKMQLDLSTMNLKVGSYVLEIQTKSKQGSSTLRDKIIFSN